MLNISKPKQIENNIKEIFEESFEDLSNLSTTYTQSPENSRPGSQNDLDEIIKGQNNERDDSYFDNRVYEQVEDFLDQEGLFIISPSPILKPIILKPSKRVHLKNLSIFHKINHFPFREEIEENKTSFAVPGFLTRRNNIMRKLTL